jgi:MFS family permease
VGPAELQSAVRLGATARYLGMLCGPAVGGILLIKLGPSHAIFVNALIYLPMIVWLWRAPYGPRFRKEEAAPVRAVRGFADVWATFRVIRENPTVLSMTLLAGGAAFFVGNAYQAQMPGFAQELGHGDPGLSYSALLGADALGALAAGFVLELGGLLRPVARTALALGMGWCVALGAFALVSNYGLALVLLFFAGFLELSFNSMAQALVQLSAPAPIRGRVIGVFSMAANGMKTFSGITVGIIGGYIGIHLSLSSSAAAVFVVIGCLMVFGARTHTLTRSP